MKKKPLRVLVVCEFSGIVRQAFADRGWDAWSADYLETEIPGQHVVGNVEWLFQPGDLPTGQKVPRKWDLVIAHPTCTYLCNSGAKHLYKRMRKENGPDPKRWEMMRISATFFKWCLDLPVLHIAVENPIMLGYAQEIIGTGPTQTIQPCWFGHPETKATCLWLKNLPPLTPTNYVDGRRPRVHFMSPGPNRWKERSRTLPGIAAAFASQWGTYIENLNK